MWSRYINCDIYNIYFHNKCCLRVCPECSAWSCPHQIGKSDILRIKEFYHFSAIWVLHIIVECSIRETLYTIYIKDSSIGVENMGYFFKGRADLHLIICVQYMRKESLIPDNERTLNWYIQINFLIECWTNLICVFLGIFYIYLFHLKICPLTNCSQIYDDFVEKLAHVAKIESQNVLTAVAARMVLDSNFLTVSWFLHQNLWPRQCRALRTKSCFTCSIW